MGGNNAGTPNGEESLFAALRKAGIRPTKKLGQHFLFDRNILLKIADSASLKEGELVLEVGPGPGGLTEILVERGAFVLAVEKDKRFFSFLSKRFEGCERIKLVCGDALQEKGEIEKLKPKKMVANLPYNIAATLILQYLVDFDFLKTMVVMVQKEVADRLSSPPRSRSYGALTVKIQSLAKVKKLFRVKPGSFYPPPKVDSEVVLVERAEMIERDEIEDFFSFVELCFRFPRKTLLNNLLGHPGLEREEAERMIEDFGLAKNTRPQELEIRKFIEFFHKNREKFVN
jgi:16S rRNA (adenine1518-N6/adenine1519-N6)-dimethyltransferase